MTTSGYSGLWNGHHGEQHAPLGSTANKENIYRKIACLLGAGASNENAKVRELLLTLVGGDVTDAALSQRKRREASANLSQNVQGGVVSIETVDDINRVTAAADVTRLLAAINESTQPSSYPTDASGNGGGGKLTQA